MRVRIQNDGGSGYTTTVTDEESGEKLQNVSSVIIQLQAGDVAPVAFLTVIRPVVDVIVDADVKQICPGCGRHWENHDT